MLSSVGHEQIQLIRPECLEYLAEPGHARLSEAVKPLPPGPSGRDQPHVCEQQQVLRDRGAADRELGRQLGHGPFTVGEKLEQPSPAGLGRNFEEVGHVNTLAFANVFGNPFGAGWILAS